MSYLAARSEITQCLFLHIFFPCVVLLNRASPIFPCPMCMRLHFPKFNNICYFSDHLTNLSGSSCKLCLSVSLVTFLNTFVKLDMWITHPQLYSFTLMTSFILNVLLPQQFSIFFLIVTVLVQRPALVWSIIIIISTYTSNN